MKYEIQQMLMNVWRDRRLPSIASTMALGGVALYAAAKAGRMRLPGMRLSSTLRRGSARDGRPPASSILLCNSRPSRSWTPRSAPSSPPAPHRPLWQAQ